MREWNPDCFSNLQELLERDTGAWDYYHALPSHVRTALRRRAGIRSAAEMQSAAADEQEAWF